MLHFPSNALSRSLEDFLREVRVSPNQILQMPIQLRWGGGMGGAVQAVQVVASWAQHLDVEHTLRLPAAFSSQEKTRDRFASTLPGMAALYFTDSIQCGGMPFSRYEALGIVAPRVKAMQSGAFRDTLRGQGVALCCFSGASNEFLTPLYSHPTPGKVRSVADFRILLDRVLKQLGQRAAATVDERQLDYLSSMVHQLFLNADEHGSFDAHGRRHDRSIRGIAVRLTSVDNVGALVQLAGDDTSFRSYMMKLGLFPKDKALPKSGDEKCPSGPIKLLEISVFDTGPGIALRWLADKLGKRRYSEFSIQAELEAVQTCFQKHSTTKSSQYFGQGLSMALQAMRKLNAFMTLRTGRLSLYQDLSRSDTVEFMPKNRFAKGVELPEISGTGYTISFKVK